MSEPKDEPTESPKQSSEAFLAWLPVVELIGRMAVLELDLEEETGVAAEQWQHRDPGSDRWRRPADLPIGALG